MTAWCKVVSLFWKRTLGTGKKQLAFKRLLWAWSRAGGPEVLFPWHYTNLGQLLEREPEGEGERKMILIFKLEFHLGVKIYLIQRQFKKLYFLIILI